MIRETDYVAVKGTEGRSEGQVVATRRLGAFTLLAVALSHGPTVILQESEVRLVDHAERAP
jgi:hypothetical protein